MTPSETPQFLKQLEMGDSQGQTTIYEAYDGEDKRQDYGGRYDEDNGGRLRITHYYFAKHVLINLYAPSITMYHYILCAIVE